MLANAFLNLRTMCKIWATAANFTIMCYNNLIFCTGTSTNEKINILLLIMSFI